ncbi:MAG: hypothetical protein FWG63_01065 [Defluviitaleaceae bacterium]|nr:hypothetical protein [Defluviitaleaceae bacterium]
MIQQFIEWLIDVVNFILIFAGVFASYKMYRLISLSIRALKVYIKVNDPKNETATINRTMDTFRKLKSIGRRK